MRNHSRRRTVLATAAPLLLATMVQSSLRRGSGAKPQRERPPTRGARAELRLLDGFELAVGHEPIHVPPMGERLVAFLALEHRPILRIYAAGRLWPNMPEAAAYANLRSALWRVNQVAPRVITSTRAHLRLEQDVDVDLHRQLEMIHWLSSGNADLPNTLDPVLFRELLPDWYDDWVLMVRESVRQLRLHALEQLATRLTREGRYADAVQAGLGALRSDPLRESGHRAVIAAYVAEGNRSEAIRHWRLYRRLLWERLRLEPAFKWEDVAQDAVPAA